MNKEYINATTHILHCDALYYINRKKYKTVCAELSFIKAPLPERGQGPYS